MKTIEQKLAEMDNDYSKIERHISEKGLNFVDKIKEKFDAVSKVSIIIPAYNLPERLQLTLDSLSYQNFDLNFVEVFVIDDNSSMDISKSVNIPSQLNVRFFRNNQNFGSGISRDIGLYHSTGEIVVFLDSDIVPSSCFLNEHVLRHQLSDNFFLIGFKENVNLKDINEWSARDPDPRKDPRFYKETAKYGLKDRVISLYSDTNRFKEFGNGKVMYLDCFPNGWTLPEAIITHSLSIKRDVAISVGGFDLDFKKWGYEDSYFGAKCLAKGLYAIPLLSCASYHIRHPRRREEPKERSRGGNRDIYLSKIKSPLVLFTDKDFKSKFSHYLDNACEVS